MVLVSDRQHGSRPLIDTLGTPVTTQYGPLGVTVSYSNSTSGLSVVVDYTLTGAPTGTGQSDLDAGITLINSGSSTMNLQFFHHSMLRVERQPQRRNRIVSNDTVDESNSVPTLAETVVSPAATHHEGAANLLGTLTSPSLRTLHPICHWLRRALGLGI